MWHSEESAHLRFRIRFALDRVQPGLGAGTRGAPGAYIRALVNEVSGAQIPNGPVAQCLRRMAAACEGAAIAAAMQRLTEERP